MLSEWSRCAAPPSLPTHSVSSVKRDAEELKELSAANDSQLVDSFGQAPMTSRVLKKIKRTKPLFKKSILFNLMLQNKVALR